MPEVRPGSASETGAGPAYPIPILRNPEGSARILEHAIFRLARACVREFVGRGKAPFDDEDQRSRATPSCRSLGNRAICAKGKRGARREATSIAIVGVGKISQDQHLPVIAICATQRQWDRSAGLVSQRGLTEPGVPTFRTPAELYAALPDLDAVAICTPPSVRHAIAREALDAGKHVLLEKPPTPTMAEFHDLVAYAAARGRVIFATWHSQYNAAVDEAKKRLAGRKIRSLHIEWKEDVRRWHPGQEWIWDAGNFGVFDPGINALSILIKIMPAPAFVRSAELVYPENRDTPIAASLNADEPCVENAATKITAEFDYKPGERPELGHRRCDGGRNGPPP